MNKDPLISALLGALFLGSVIIMVLGVRYHFQARESRRLQAQLAAIQNTQMVVTTLANEAVEYSKRNPAIDPILIQAGIKPAGRATTR